MPTSRQSKISEQSRIEEIKQWAEEAREEWLKEHSDKEKVKHVVFDRLDTDLVSIVAKLLGFDDHWGRWEVDHCNGRGGQSAAGDFIKQMAGEAVTEWLLKQAKKLPKLPPTTIKALRKDYRTTYERELREKLHRLAGQQAGEDAERIFKEITGQSDELEQEE